MGLFILCLEKNPKPEDLINSAIANIEIHIEKNPCRDEYLLTDFALNQLREALALLAAKE